MGQQIIKQPNSKFAMFSTESDIFTALDCTPEDIKKILVESATKSIEESLKRIIGQLEKGEKPYNQFTIPWTQAIYEHNSENCDPEWAKIVEKTILEQEI